MICNLNPFRARNRILFIIGVIILSCDEDKILSQWRGPDRDGKYPDKGLLNEWPAAGPEMLWHYEGLGIGHGSVGFSKDRIFVLGMKDTAGFLFAFDLEGKLMWKSEYGKEWYLSYAGSRSTPVVAGNLVYFTSGFGKVFCYEAGTGRMRWSVDMHERFGAQKIEWGITENLLIEGDRIFSTPGGKEYTVAALNRHTGETIWACRGNGDPSAYCSPVLIKRGNTALFVTMTGNSVIGVDAESGQFYWQIPHLQRFRIHANTPVYADGRIFCAGERDDTLSGLLAVSLSEDGKKAEVQWRNEKIENLMGGVIYHDGYLYCSQYQKRKWSCINPDNGSVLYSSDALWDGAMIWADSLFYCYTERGDMALVSADTASFHVISKFRVSLGSEQHWAHPVIHQGRLYIRHGNALMVYNIRSE